MKAAALLQPQHVSRGFWPRWRFCPGKTQSCAHELKLQPRGESRSYSARKSSPALTPGACHGRTSSAQRVKSLFELIMFSTRCRHGYDMRSRSSVGKSIRTQLLTTPDRMQRRGSQACLIIADLTTLDRFLSTTDYDLK